MTLEPRSHRLRAVLLSAVVLGILGVVAGVGSYSAFTATTTNTGNSFAAGTVAISDNDNDNFMLALTNAKPSDADTSCIKVTYTGSLSSTVRLYSTQTGTLGQYLTLTVTRGTDSSPSFDSCTNFTADATNYIGQGAGVIYSGNLSGFATTYNTGLVDPLAGTPESWTTNETHTYKFVITLQDVNAAQGLTGTAGFTWEARNQ
jgi:predicted ribosomally synthesized peptide with SipW-like signal peptide